MGVGLAKHKLTRGEPIFFAKSFGDLGVLGGEALRQPFG